MFKKTILFSIFAASFGLTACSDPKDANKDNFGNAIQEYLDTEAAVCIDYPESILSVPESSPYRDSDKVLVSVKDEAEPMLQDRYKQLDYLKQKGLFTEKTELVEARYGFGNQGQIEAKVYSPTEKLKSYLVEPTNEIERQFIRDKICTGKVVLDEIGNFTEPSDELGMKASRVSYTVKTKDIADWASDAQFDGLFRPQKWKDGESKRIALILTNEGWKSEQLMKQQ